MDTQKTIIAIAGEPASGKGTVTSKIVLEYGGHAMRYSQVLEDVLRRLTLQHNRSNLAALGEALRTTFGGDVLSKALAEDIKKDEHNVFVVEGIRKGDELEYLQKAGNVFFVFVDADIETRYRRIVERNEKVDDATKTFEDFQKDHEKPADRDVAALKNVADFVINNNGILGDTQIQIDDMMKNIL